MPVTMDAHSQRSGFEWRMGYETDLTISNTWFNDKLSISAIR